MKAISLENLFGKDWKHWDAHFTGSPNMFTYNGCDYLPLDECRKCNYIIQCNKIEEIDINED